MFLHINTSKTWRGGENQLFLLAKGLKKKNFQQIILCNEHSSLSEKCKKEGLRFLTLPFEKKFQFFSNLNKIQEIITKNNIKLIHAHTAKSHTFGLMSKIRSKHLKLVISRRVDFHIQKNFLSRWKYKTKLNDYFLCVSQNIRNILIKDGINPDKLVTVYSGTPLEKQKNNNKQKDLFTEFNLDKKTILIGNVAALVEHKDQKTLLKAIPHIQTDKKYKFLIIGEGKLKKKLEKQCKSLNIEDKVIFTGFRTDIENILTQLDIFTLTSKEEGLGTSLLEAMKKGLPIVATRGGGIVEVLVDKQGSFLADIGNFQTLAKYYTQLIENESLRKDFGLQNKKYVEKFSIESTIQKTIQVYYFLLGEKLFHENEQVSTPIST